MLQNDANFLPSHHPIQKPKLPTYTLPRHRNLTRPCSKFFHITKLFSYRLVSVALSSGCFGFFGAGPSVSGSNTGGSESVDRTMTNYYNTILNTVEVFPLTVEVYIWTIRLKLRVTGLEQSMLLLTVRW